MIDHEQLDELILKGILVPCSVTTHCGSYLVTFKNGSRLLLQDGCDQATFAVDCGFIDAPTNWNGAPSSLPGWGDRELCDIRGCPGQYAELAAN